MENVVNRWLTSERVKYPRGNNYSRNARAAISISLAHFSLMLMGVLFKARVRGQIPSQRSSHKRCSNSRMLALLSSAVETA